MYNSCKKKEYKDSAATDIFLWLLLASVIVLSVLAFLLWWVPTTGLGNINSALPYIVAAVLAGLIIFLSVSSLLLALSASGFNVLFAGSLRGLLVKFFFPAISFLAGIFNIDKIKIHKSFVEINNRLVRSMVIKTRPDAFLVLMPHCLQFQDCKFKVTKDI